MQLPYPAVDYWTLYAAFLGLAREPSDRYSLCECSRGALANAIRLERVNQASRHSFSDPNQRLPLWATDEDFFDLDFDAHAATKRFRFLDKACHRCNLVAPNRRYCDPQYGGAFRQTYGWYTSLNHYALGVKPTSLMWLPDAAPPELAELLAGVPTDRIPSIKNTPRRTRAGVERFVENATRAEFRVNSIGEGWISESLLAKLVAQLYPHEGIIRHLRPDWLGGLELDIWLPTSQIGIEYQG